MPVHPRTLYGHVQGPFMQEEYLIKDFRFFLLN